MSENSRLFACFFPKLSTVCSLFTNSYKKISVYFLIFNILSLRACLISYTFNEFFSKIYLNFNDKLFSSAEHFTSDPASEAQSHIVGPLALFFMTKFILSHTRTNSILFCHKI